MRFIRPILTFLFVSAISSVAFAQETSWLRTKTIANALNPNVSVIGDFVANTGPMYRPGTNRIALREAELGLQASVDPYARADFFVSFPEGEAVELEEGYVSLLALPLGLKARGGKFRANFGRLNLVHPHELPFVNAPQAISQFLGAEGLNDTGAEVSRIFGLGSLFTEVSYSLLNGLGPNEAPEAVTTTVTDTSGNTVTVKAERPETTTERQFLNFAHLARVRLYHDLTDSANLELGFSGGLHQPKKGKQTKLGGADLTFRWKPLQEGLYRSFTWRTEGIYSDRKLPQETSLLTGAVTTAERRLHRRGIYSYIEVQPARRWKFGVLGDYAEAPEALDSAITLRDGTTTMVGKSITRSFSPFVTFTLSEFNRFRLQYENRMIPGDDVEHRAFLQWTVVLGPHGAHPF